MRHLKTISQIPAPASEKSMDIYETVIIVILSVIFKDWDNFVTVVQNLEKYYQKTP